MKKKNSLKINFIMNIILNISTIIYPLITFPYVSRVLGTTGTGKISFASSFISYFVTFASLGIPTYGIKVIAQKRDNRKECSRAAHELIIINLITTIIAYGLFFILMFNIPKLNNDKPLYIISSLSIGLNALGMEWLYKGFEEYSYITKRTLIFKLIALLGLFLLVKNQNDYYWYAFLTVFGTSGSYIMNIIGSKKYIDYKYVGSYHIIQHLKPIIYLVCASLITSLYAHMDSTMIGLMIGDDSNGLYYATVRIKSLLITISSALTTVLIPRMAYYFANRNLDKISIYIKKAISAVSLISFPLLIYSFIMAKECLDFFAGTEYVAATNTLRVQLIACGLVGYSSIWGNQILVPSGNEKAYFKSVSIGAVVNLVLNSLFIPFIGIIGAAIATMCTEGVVCIALYRNARSYILEHDNFKQSMIYGVACIPSIVCIIVIKRFLDIDSIFLELCVTAILFFGIYCVIMVGIVHDKLFMEVINGIRKKYLKK